MSAFTDEDYRRVLNERDEARAEVDHWRVKAEAYGGMVHGCGPVLESAGHPIDPFHPDGRVGGIARSVAALVKERDEARAEVERLRAEAAPMNEHFNAGYRDGARDAYRRGAEAMREACARWMSEREGIAKWVYDDALSALPIPEEP